MSGLNPDGLGNTTRFSNAEGESLGTENATINGADDTIADFPFWIRALNAAGDGRGIALQGYDDGSAGADTDKAPIRWYTRDLSDDVMLAQMVAHQIDEEWSLYTRDEGVSTGSVSNQKRLNIRTDIPATELTVVKPSSELARIKTAGDGQEFIFEHNNFDQLAIYFDDGGKNNLLILDGVDNYADWQQTETRSVVWESDTTANRPSSPVVGERFFDTTLGQPIWFYDGDWRDATGSTV